MDSPEWYDSSVFAPEKHTSKMLHCVVKASQETERPHFVCFTSEACNFDQHLV